MALNLNTSLPQKSIKVSFIDTDGQKVDNISVEQANKVAKSNPSQKFLFQTGDGTRKELTIDEVNKLKPENTLPTSSCATSPQECGPPLVQFFGGGGGYGAAANAVISPISSSVIGFDIVNAGKNYTSPPFAELVDNCGKGSGSRVSVNVSGGKIKNIAVDAPGDGYLSAPDGSLGGNERVWKEADEGYVLTANGEYYVVPYGTQPTLNTGDTYIPPSKPAKPRSIYPVILAIDEIKVVNPGFGYRPGDKIIVGNGAVLEPVINQYGEIEKVNVINPGIGFEDLPDIRTDSPTGFNAQLLPILKVIPLEQVTADIPRDATIITVVDCVGKIAPKTTFDIVPQ